MRSGHSALVPRRPCILPLCRRRGALLAPVGTGSVDGKDGSIQAGLDGITTALQPIDGVEVGYTP